MPSLSKASLSRFDPKTKESKKRGSKRNIPMEIYNKILPVEYYDKNGIFIIYVHFQKYIYWLTPFRTPAI